MGFENRIFLLLDFCEEIKFYLCEKSKRVIVNKFVYLMEFVDNLFLVVNMLLYFYEEIRCYIVKKFVSGDVDFL